MAEDLTILEPGLELIQVEYPLPSRRGASGRVDILARDDTDMLVVIEVKANEKTTREALHELAKYAAIVAEVHGRGPEDVRCVLASTDWRELKQSFSELTIGWDYRVDGFVLQVDDDGHLVSAHEAPSQSRAPMLYVCPEHLIFLFKSAAERDRHALRLRKGLLGLGVVDHVLIGMEYGGNSDRVIFQHCIYMAVGAVSHHTTSERGTWSEETDILRRLLSAVPSSCVEMGSPDIFQTMTEWRVTESMLSGRFRDNRLWNDSTLRRRVVGERLVIPSRFEALCRPVDARRWESVQAAALTRLEGNRLWTVALSACIAMSAEDPAGRVEIYIFDPQDILLTLQCAQRDGFNYNPLFRYTHEGRDGESFEVCGTLAWEGRVADDDWAALLAPYGGSVMGYMAHRVNHATSVGHTAQLALLGLKYVAMIGGDKGWATLELGAEDRLSVAPLRPPALPMDLLANRPDLGLWLDKVITPSVPYPTDAAP